MLQLAATMGATTGAALETLRTAVDDIVCLTTVVVRKWETLSFISSGIEKVYQFFFTLSMKLEYLFVFGIIKKLIRIYILTP
jgi:hypothetical protein